MPRLPGLHDGRIPDANVKESADEYLSTCRHACGAGGRTARGRGPGRLFQRLRRRGRRHGRVGLGRPHHQHRAGSRLGGMELRRRRRRVLPAGPDLRRLPTGQQLRDPGRLRARRLHVRHRQRRRHLHRRDFRRRRGRRMDGGDGANRAAGQHPRLRGPAASQRVLLRHGRGLHGGRLRLRAGGTARQGLHHRRGPRQCALGRDRPEGRRPLPALQRLRPTRRPGADLRVRPLRRRRPVRGDGGLRRLRPVHPLPGGARRRHHGRRRRHPLGRNRGGHVLVPDHQPGRRQRRLRVEHGPVRHHRHPGGGHLDAGVLPGSGRRLRQPPQRPGAGRRRG